MIKLIILTSDISDRVIIKQIDNIEFKNIEYKYGNNKVISNANFILQKGKSYCLLGVVAQERVHYLI